MMKFSDIGLVVLSFTWHFCKVSNTKGQNISDACDCYRNSCMCHCLGYQIWNAEVFLGCSLDIIETLDDDKHIINANTL